MLQVATIKFLKEITKNNNREWFDDNRKRYDDAKADFEEFVSALITQLTKVNKNFAGLEAKGCVFRIYRDVRFSKNKLPYKNNMSASIKEGGKKSNKCGVYIHIEPSGDMGCMIAGGFWQPEAPVLKAIRQEIEYHTAEFKKIIANKEFKKWYGELENEKLKNAPKGIEKDHPDVEFFKYKSYIASHTIALKNVNTPSLITECVTAYKALKPLLDFLNRAVV